MRPGPANLITDVAGLSVGHATDLSAATGVTVLLAHEPAVASVAVLGGAPGTRETDLLAPEQTVAAVDALVLSGGSAFGLEAAGGVMQALAARGRGFAVGPARVPIVPAAILFDLLQGEKPWLDGRSDPPYRAFGADALAAAGPHFELGSVGAGTGATTATLKGGIGSASVRLASGVTVGALAAVNALGSVVVADTGRFWAAPFELAAEFGGLGSAPATADASAIRIKGLAEPVAATTIAVVATDAALTKAQARRLAVAAHDGFARAIWPAHTPFDGDLVFALSTGRLQLADPDRELVVIGAAAAAAMARAIARGVHAAGPVPGCTLPTWRERYGSDAH